MSVIVVEEVLTFIFLLSLVIWVGSIIFFSFFAAPSIFKVLERESAGNVIGEIFPKYWLVGYFSAVFSLSSLLYLTYKSPDPPPSSVLYILIAMTGTAFFSGLVVGGKAREVKAKLRAKEHRHEADALRARFRKIHALSSILNMAVLVMGLVLTYLTSRAIAW